MLSFLSFFILLLHLNLSDQNKFLSRGEGYTQGKVTHDPIKHRLSSPACPLPTCNSLSPSTVCIHLYYQDAGIIDRWFFSYTKTQKIVCPLTAADKYNIFYLYLWAITYKSTSVSKWNMVKKEICVYVLMTETRQRIKTNRSDNSGSFTKESH